MSKFGPRLLLLPMCFVAIAQAACSGNDRDVTATPTTGPASSTATLSASPAPPETPAPTPVPGPAFLAVSVDGRTSTRLGVGSSASWSPDSSRVAIASREEGIVVVELNSMARRIIRAGPCQWVDWAPTGQLLAAGCGTRTSILRIDGSEVSSHDVAGDIYGWSPNGATFALSSWRAPLTIFDGTAWIGLDTDTRWFRWLRSGSLAVVSQPDEKGPATILILRGTPGYPIALERATRAGALPRSVSVSPDGRLAAYGIANPGSAAGNHLDGTVVLLDLDTGAELAVVTANPPDYPSLPIQFSPDSSNALVQTDVCREWNLVTLGRGGTLRQVASGGFYVAEYSPDGTMIAFSRGLGLWIVPADGGAAPRELATGIHGPAGFEWSPDGKWIAVPEFFGGFGACE